MAGSPAAVAAALGSERLPGGDGGTGARRRFGAGNGGRWNGSGGFVQHGKYNDERCVQMGISDLHACVLRPNEIPMIVVQLRLLWL